MIEETGWSLVFCTPIGVLHFTHVRPMSEGQGTQPDFLQVVYAGTPGKYQPELKETDGYEIGAEFVSTERVRQMTLGTGQETLHRNCYQSDIVIALTSRSPMVNVPSRALFSVCP